MRLLYKMPLAMAGIVALYFVAVVGLQRAFLLPRFYALEKSTALRNLDRVTAAVNREALHLAVLDRDWSSWDDTYDFMASGSASYLSTNLSPDSLRSARVDFVALYGVDGSLRFQGVYDWSRGTMQPTGFLPSPAPERSPLLHGAGPGDDITGFMDCPLGVLLLASTPILRTDGSGPARGRFIMGRFIDPAFARVISEQTSLRLELKPSRNADSSEIASIVAQGGRMVELDAAVPVLQAFGVLRDLWGSPVLIVRTETARSLSAWARETMRIANALFYSFGLVFFLILFFLLRRLVVRPILAIQGHLVRSESDETASIPQAIVSRRDEIGALASAFTHIGRTLASRRRELQRVNESLEAAVEARTGELRVSNEDLRLMAKVFESTAESIVITNLDGKILRVNPAFCRTSGYSEQELHGQNPRIMKSDRHKPSFYQALWKKLSAGGSWSGEIWDRRKTGEIFLKWLTINLIRDETGAPIAYVGISSDITDVKQAEERLHRLAYYDPLTGLPNRSLFLDQLERSLVRGQRYGLRVALLFIDLDRFKYVNDAMGHSTGDVLLTEVARRIASKVRKADTVCRIGGDEFTVILDRIRRSEDAAVIAQSIIEEVDMPFTLNGQEVFIGASIGIAIYPYDESTAEGLTRKADAAMYHAKTAGRNSFRFVSGQTDAVSQSRLSLESELRRAQERGEFLLHYQPLVSIDGNRVLGAEALIRWRRPGTGELASPGVFIPLAEETGTILRIGAWVLRDACATAVTWRSRGVDLFVSVNVSPRQFGQPGITREIGEVLAATGFPPDHLVVEITESTVMSDVMAAERTMRELKDVGVSIAIDDFGTGYSSLSYLSRFPVDRLKIDQSFVRKLGDTAHADAIVNAIISMARSLGLGTVAEGVETEAQRRFLEERGCLEGQGYLFSKPVPADDFLAFAESHGALRNQGRS
jgi:diguanylate cyclase (GGDEF)-like protein/PAS domain S-box-containing protein